MGLGKTLTMISLVVRQKELDPAPPASSDIWLSKTVKIKRSSGTLVVCPASVVGKSLTDIKLEKVVKGEVKFYFIFLSLVIKWLKFN